MESTASKLPDISGYTITEQIYQSSRTKVYRAVDNSQNFSVVIKVLQKEYPTFGELVKFRNQYAITNNLAVDGIVKPLSLEKFGNGYALVMEDDALVSLDKYFQQQSLDLDDILAIAIQITDILHELHQHRVIHKDIKPANILINLETKQVKLIDFSIASLLPKETQEIQNPNVLEGTLAYISPEQTGRMNRGIDYRSDFYSFGITLYQLLTGSLPFDVSEPLELIHCHIAKITTPVHEVSNDIPKIVGAIVAKLMAKNAEDRYQSALGIKHDLQRCLSQWHETGKITEFALAQRDFCDQFIIPEKLYGREAEVKSLLDAFERVTSGTSELVLVAGFSGIGKTAVVNEVQKPITRQRGYFIKGKFDQFNRNIPFSAFVQAFRSLMGQLLGESDTQLSTWKNQILQALGDNGQVVIEIIPELEKIIGKQPPVTELSGAASENRFNLLFEKFIHIFTTKEHPLVIFLDDLQWADSASLKLMQLLMSESSDYLLMIGAYRDNEVFPSHPLMLTLAEISQTQGIINTITLAPLSETSLNSLVADTLNCSKQIALQITQLIYQKTKGNPFFSTQFLKGLYEDNLIKFDVDNGSWICNITEIKSLALTDDVVEFMANQIQKLPELTQDILKLAACIGNQFDLETLAVISQQSQIETSATLWKALQAGIILPQNEVYKFYLGEEQSLNQIHHSQIVTYRFLHDRVQQAAYSLIINEQKKQTHLQIGQLLLKNIPQHEQEKKIFDIINQLNFGLDLIEELSQKYELARLNLIASFKAKDATAYVSAAKYAENCQQLLPENSWDCKYQFTLSLYQLQVEIAYLSGDFIRMETLAQEVLQRSKTVLDKVKIYKFKVEALTAQKDLLGAVNSGLEILKMLGIEFPNQPSPDDIDTAFKETAIAIAGRKTSELLELPQMQKAEYVNAMHIMIHIIPCTHMAQPQLFPLLGLKLIYLSLIYGNAPASGYGYAVYAILLWDAVGDITSAYEFACLGLELSLRSPQKNLQPKTAFAAYCFIMHWKQHLSQSLQPIELCFFNCLEVGDLAHAGYCVYTLTSQALYIGKPLNELALRTASYSETLQKNNQINTFSYNEIFRQTILNLTGDVENPVLLIGEAFDEKHQLPILENANDGQGLAFLFINKLFLAYNFADFDEAIKNAANARKYLHAITAMYIVPVFYIYDSLSQLQKFILVTESEKIDIFQDVNTNQDKMRNWATYAPMNFQHKYDLVEAEKYRVLGNKLEALELYDKAISGAKENGYLQEEALANELAAKFYLDWDKEKVAAGYMQEAYYCYSRWGAKAKINDLETRYPELLHPILQQTTISVDILDTFATISSDDNNSTQSNTSLNQAFDFASIFKSSQILAGTIEIDELLHKLTQIILQNSGGDRCALIIPDENEEWQVRAISTPENTQLCNEPLDNNPNLPLKFIQYVKNTQEVLVVDNLETDLPVIDEYLIQRQPKSLLGLPILNQGHLIGILYLKNLHTSGVFTSNRVQALNFLCTQAAVSLENARLFEEIQQAKTELLHKNIFLKAQQESSLDGILVVDTQQKVTAYNQRFASIWNISKTILATRDDRQIVNFVLEQLEDPTEFVEKIDYLYNHPEESSHDEITLTEERFVERYSAPIKLPSGEFKGRIWFFRDISDRKKTEAKQKRQLDILETTSDLIGTADPTGIILYLNQAWKEFLQNNEGNPDNRVSLSDQHPSWALDIVINEALPTAAKNGVWLGETSIFNGKGQEIPISQLVLAHKSADGEVEYFSTVIRDISEKKKAEKKLQASEKRYSTLASSAPVGIFRTDAEGNCIYVNERWCKITGISSEDAAGDGWQKALHPEDSEAIFKEWYQSAQENRPFSLEYRFQRPDATVSWVYGQSVVEWDADGKVTGYVGTVTDISDRKVYEEQLQQTNADLMRATRMKDEFLATMSHELRTPLNSILGMTESLQEEIFGEINPKQLKALNQVEHSGNHLLKLINDILDLSKITAEKMELESEETDLLEICDSSLQMIQQLAQKKNIQLQTNLPATLPKFILDEQRIKQVLINLLSNGVKFTPDGGQVSLIINSQPIKDDTDNYPHGFFRITVKDTGIGISPENIEKLFKPFVQIDSALNRQYEGTGLGLSLVKSIVELHGGRVKVESEVGVGSSFIVDIPWLTNIPSFPIKETEMIEPEPETEPQTEPQATNHQLVLLVEDDEANILTISTYLEAKGYHLAVAENGEDAIELVKTLHPKVILMDIQMPVMDGLTATKYIRQQLKITDTPIITLTALAMKGDEERCLAAGANHYLSKPVRLKQLDKLLQQYLLVINE